MLQLALPPLQFVASNMCLTLHYEYSCHLLASETVILPCRRALDGYDLAATSTDDQHPITVCPRSWVKKTTPPKCVSCLMAVVQGPDLPA